MKIGKMRNSFIIGVLVGVLLCLSAIGITDRVQATETGKAFAPLKFQLYINGKATVLNEAYIKDGRTFVQLRELADATNMIVEWRDPAQHMLFAPGGGLPEGINLTNPTFVYVYEVTDFDNTSETIQGVEITGIYNMYRDDASLKYEFNDEGLIIRGDEGETMIPLDYNPNNGRMYLEVLEFKSKVLPHLADICMQ